MAQPIKQEAVAMSTPDGVSRAASRAATPLSRTSPKPPSNPFQAINSMNSRAVAEDAHVASPAPATQPRDNSADPTPPTSHVTGAQGASQTPQTSVLASLPSKMSPQVDALDASMAETAYGTRSRNRTNARPNYAEDQDMDFEFTSAATTTSSKKKTMPDASTSAGSTAPDSKRAQEVTAFHAINHNASNSATTAAKESTTGNPGIPAGPSKKRKAAGTSAAALQTPAASSTPPPAAARKSAASTSLSVARETNVMTFFKHKSCLNKRGELVADDGTKLHVNDHVYLVCEPPGDPYYLCRIMEFLHVESDNPASPIDSIRVNWYYRPRDVQRFSTDTRLVFATMHSDMCPVTSLRGKCTIKHRSEIWDLEAYRKERESFYFVQVFDRFIRRSYECIPVQQIINVPEKVKKALDERWRFVVVEIGRVKELTSAAKTCKRCARYCASSDSVDCAICKNAYHMNCVQPPLPKKPSRGFAWACGPCSRASEKKNESDNTPNSGVEEEDAVEEEEAPAISNDTTRAPSPSESEMIVDDHPATQAEIALAKMWPMRYLGIHARVEDALQYDDRAIYPRASSRLGPRHQANVNMWHGRPVELVKAAEIKKRYNKGATGKKEGKLTKETLAAIEADREEKAKRPKWVQDEPTGYIPRGEDYPSDDPRCTAKLMFKMPSIEEHPKAVAGEDNMNPIKRQETFMDNYISRAKPLAKVVGVPPFGTNFIDKAFELLTTSKYNVDAALKQLAKVDRRGDLHEPVFSKSDLVKFEEAVAKYGSEHHLIRLHMKTTLPPSDIVRFYYLWKKTPKGREIWGNYGGRKKRKLESDAGAKLQAEISHDVDDSAFDYDKALRKSRGFQCKFCGTQHSRQWRKAPGVAPGQVAITEGKGDKKDKRPLLALCIRCAGLWRKYAIQWEEIDEVAKKVSSAGGRAWKKKIDEELLRELIAANEAVPSQEQAAAMLPGADSEPPKKKSKMDRDAAQIAAAANTKKEKPPPPPKEPTPPPPPIIPAQPSWRTLPCGVCKAVGDTIACAHCKLTVHRRCFGLREDEGLRANGEAYWVCEQCQNDRNPTVSTNYSCCLCLTEETVIDLVEQPRVSHKKKNDRDRERERLEKELADNLRAEHRNRQLLQNRPVFPREPLKRTTGNNWVHVHCALWAQEIRFSDAKKLEVAEGFQLIPQAKYEAVCKLCKNKDHQNRFRENAGACINCFQCNASFHASCAFEAGYTFGFDVQPVKGSRKDQITTATLGQETGLLNAVVLCKEHVVKGILHPVDEIVDDTGKTALQVFAESYKQADLTLTGTVRKAAQAQLTKEKGQQPAPSSLGGNRRESGAHSIAAAVKRGARTSSVADTKAEAEDGSTEIVSAPEADSTERRCVKCNVDVTPKWHPVVENPPQVEDVKSPNGRLTHGDAADVIMLDSNGTPTRPPEPPRQNIRFMAPGTSGRAWDGMPERYGPRPGEPATGVPVGTPSRDPNVPLPVELNGEHRLPPEDSNKDDGYHTHALPRHQNPAAARPLNDQKMVMVKEEEPKAFLCHKCFLKKKLDPTPPPEERSDRMALSPPRQFPVQLDSFGQPSQTSGPPTIEQQFEIWDKPIRQSLIPPPGPPQLNGYGPSPHYNPNAQPLPPQNGGYQPHLYGPQPNGGYHQGPVPGHPPSHPGPPATHERHGSYGYPPQPSPNQPPHQYGPPSHAPPNHHRPPPLGLHGPPPGAPIANGMSSPHTSAPPPMQSPTYQYGPSQPPPGHGLRVPPLRPFDFGPLVAPNQYGYPYPEPNGAIQQGSPHQQTPQPPPPETSPSVGQARPDGQPMGPGTPRTGQQANGLNPSAASASPSLMNLLH